MDRPDDFIMHYAGMIETSAMRLSFMAITVIYCVRMIINEITKNRKPKHHKEGE